MPHPVRPAVAAVLALLSGALLAQNQPGKPLPQDRAAGAELITVPKLKQWLGTLASEEFGGRGTGQEGFQKAADFVAAHFRSLGLQPRGDDGSYFQHVPWGTSKVDAAATAVTFLQDGKEVLRIPAERLQGNASAALDASGEVVLLTVPLPERPAGEAGQRGRRGQVPEVKIDGLDQLDLTGKVVVVHLQAEGSESAQQAVFGQFAVQRALAGKGAAVLLFAQTEPVSGGLQGRAGAQRRAGNPAIAGMARSPLSATFGGPDLTALLAAAKVDRAALGGKQVAPKLAPLTAKVQVVVKEDKAPAMNVVAVLPGSDPKLKDEYVVIGSHLDHLGRRGDAFFPGADDDGSGSTGVLAVSEAFAKNPVRPKRSILFVTFCGEEAGLIGSSFFVEHSPIPLSAIVGELQMDMIGRDEEENVEGNKGEKAEDNRNSLHLIGTQKLSADLHQLCMQKNHAAGFDLEWDQEGMFSRSDHANFARQGVPIAFFFTGLHRDYHRQSDTPDKIHYEKLGRVARYVYDIGFDLAQQDARPLVDEELWAKNKGGIRGVDMPAAPVRKAGAGK